MSVEKSELRIRGKSIFVPTATVDGREVIATGRLFRTAMLKDEEWQVSALVIDPASFATSLRASGLRADILAFSGRLNDPPVAIEGKCEVDNAAVIRTDDISSWWDNLPQTARKNARRAAKKGIEIRVATLDEDFAEGIKVIYDETPVRQGRPFWHYGKDLATVKRENGSYLDRSEFLGAYYLGQLVGFMKWVYVGDVARIMQILCLDAHQDKRPITALIVKAVNVCHEKGMRYLAYGKFTYGRKTESSITEFKRRLGFAQMNFPRYYIPMSWWGSVVLRMGAHKGILDILPPSVIARLAALRAWWVEIWVHKNHAQVASIEVSSHGPAGRPTKI